MKQPTLKRDQYLGEQPLAHYDMRSNVIFSGSVPICISLIKWAIFLSLCSFSFNFQPRNWPKKDECTYDCKSCKYLVVVQLFSLFSLYKLCSKGKGFQYIWGSHKKLLLIFSLLFNIPYSSHFSQFTIVHMLNMIIHNAT